jgi:hypothetical protein
MEWLVLEARLRAARVKIRGEKIHKVLIWFLRKVNSKMSWTQLKKVLYQIEVL